MKTRHEQGICIFCGGQIAFCNQKHLLINESDFAIGELIEREKQHIAEINFYDEMTDEDWQKQIITSDGEVKTVHAYCSPTNDSYDGAIAAVRFDPKKNQIVILGYAQCDGSFLLKFNIAKVPDSGCICVSGEDLSEI